MDTKRTFFLLALFLAALTMGGPGDIYAASAGVSNATLQQNTSINWAGYIAQDASYTQVGASWTLPTPKPAGSEDLASDAAWVGMGGVKSTDLIQAGTQALVQNGRVTYRAWYEILPATQTQIPVAVHGGDEVTVSLTEVGKNLWHLSFINNTTNAGFQKDIVYKSSHSSAEWIQERPLVVSGRHGTFSTLDDFGTITFTDAFTMVDGKRMSLSEAGTHSVVMESSGRTVLATPSTLTSTSSGFSITRADAKSDNAVASPYRSARSYTSSRRGVVITLPGGETLRLRLILGR